MFMILHTFSSVEFSFSFGFMFRAEITNIPDVSMYFFIEAINELSILLAVAAANEVFQCDVKMNGKLISNSDVGRSFTRKLIKVCACICVCYYHPKSIFH